MIATGEAKPREGEAVLDPAAIESAMLETELQELIAVRDQFKALQVGLRNVRDICVDRTSGACAAKLEKLPGLVDRILVLLNGVVVKRDPTLVGADAQGAAGAEGGTSTIPVGAVASIRDVADALAAIADYFARFEPSSPALLLVRQAEQLMGKSFLDAMRVLLPNQMEQAAIQIGRDQQLFDLPIERLSAFAEVAADPPRLSEDARPSEADSSAEQIETANRAEATPLARRLEAKTRPDAVRLLEQIGTYYRIAEPSSPVPFLTDRARSFVERDFLSLLKELLPESAFRETSGR
jgi:type VI secretion system protein ImpA